MDDLDVTAWFFLAVASVDRNTEVPLDEAIAAADAINHAVLLKNEVETSVQFLVGQDLVEATALACQLTDAGRHLIGGCESRSWHASLDRVRAALGRLPERPIGAWHISPEDFKAACDAYRRRQRKRRS